MIYGSVCSGIEAASQAWHPLGWKPAFFSEIDKFPSAVLAHHYGSNMPDEPVSGNGVPNYGDMTDFERWPDHAIDILVGGTPCQDYSLAGLRKGMAGDRGSLTLTFIKIAARYRPKWFIWENVPGVLSSNDGRDFARFLGDITGTKIDVPKDGWRNSGIVAGIPDAYGVAYVVRDAQFVRVDGFGRAVPQRRRRVFVVGYIGDWRCAVAVLFEPESLQGNSEPVRKAGQGIAGNAKVRAGSGSHWDGLGVHPSLNQSSNIGGIGSSNQELFSQRGAGIVPHVAARLVAFGGYEVDGTSSTIQSRDHKGATDLIAFSSKDYGGDAMLNVCPTIRAGGHDGSHANAGIPPAIAFKPSLSRGAGSPPNYNVFPTLKSDHGRGLSDQFPHIASDWAVRRLTPVECERLQGFPDDHTRIPWRGKPAAQCPDGPRYKALGNSMAVNVMRWIGRRIEMIEGIING